MNPITIGIIMLVASLALTVLIQILQSRDKIQIKIDGITYLISPSHAELKVSLNGELERSGAEKTRYLIKVLVQPADEQAYGELSKHFSLPVGDGIPFNGPLTVRKNYRVPLSKLAGSNYKPVHKTSLKTLRSATEGITKELEEGAYKIGLMWGESKKIKWKTITKEDYGKWVAF